MSIEKEAKEPVRPAVDPEADTAPQPEIKVGSHPAPDSKADVSDNAPTPTGPEVIPLSHEKR